MKNVLDRLKQTNNLLDDDEKLLLSNHANQLRNVFKPGIKRLNWCSLAVDQFIVSCEKVNKKNKMFVFHSFYIP